MIEKAESLVEAPEVLAARALAEERRRAARMAKVLAENARRDAELDAKLQETRRRFKRLGGMKLRLSTRAIRTLTKTSK